MGEQYAEALAEHADLWAPARELEKGFWQAIGDVPPGAWASGEVRDLWQGIVARTLRPWLRADEAAFRAVFEELFARFGRPEAWALLPGAAEAVRGLYGRGVRLAVLSNADARLRTVLEGHGLGDCFAGWFFSAQTGVLKPQTEAFRQVEAHFGAGAADCAHVGDSARADAAGALAAGWRAFLLRPEGGQEEAAAGAETVGDLRELLARTAPGR